MSFESTRKTKTYQRYQRLNRSLLGPFAADLLSKKIFIPESIQADIDAEIKGAQISDEERRDISVRHLANLIYRTAERDRFGDLDFAVSMDDAQEYCEKLAHDIEDILIKHRLHGWPEWYEKQCLSAKANPLTFWGFYHLPECQTAINAVFQKHQHVPAPDDLADSEVLPFLLRITDKKWWFRQYRKRYVRTLDEIARALGRVKKRRAPYVSDDAMTLFITQQLRNKEIIDNTDCINNDGETFALADVVESSTANPAVRRAELMTRLRGFEILAETLGYKAEFWTITCPSRFHPTITKQGKNYAYSIENPKWVSAGRPSVKDAQRHLTGVWARTRAALKRVDIDWFGFRIAEPHGDGCPHWHLVVYVPADHVSSFSSNRHGKTNHKNRNVVYGSVAQLGRKYALSDSPDEHGAAKHRFTVEPIREGYDDAGRPYSATGYVAKYISKNIDGEGLAGLEDWDGGGSLADNSKRVIAWASVHGIRQFQQFGGAPVGLWRELRRLYKLQEKEAADAIKAGRDYHRDEFLDRLFEQTEQDDAAEAWASFCLIYAANPARFKFEFTVKVMARPVLNIDLDTGLLREFSSPRVVVGRYGEIQQKLEGISINQIKYETRPHNWQLVRRTVAPPEAGQLSGAGNARAALDLCQ